MKRQIVILAHNIRSLWNVGALFRTSDAFAIEKIYLTGYTAVPPRREISKTALGAEEWIQWEQGDDPLAVIQQLKNDGYTIVALEKTNQSTDLISYEPPGKIALILGHEVSGVSDDLLAHSDAVVHIPMRGKKESLNVSVATGIALHHLQSATNEAS